MGEYLSFPFTRRQKIMKNIKESLEKETSVIFAYVFGSFLVSPSFRDIDIGVYLNDIREDQVNDIELKLSEKVSQKCELPFDIMEVRVLNFAPNSFLNNIFRNGEILFSRNERLLTDLIEKTSRYAIDNEYLSRQSLKELIPS